MLDFLPFALNAVFALLALVSIGLIAREAVARLAAGPVRFRLSMASASAPWPVTASWLDPLSGLRLRDFAAYGWVRMCLLLALLSIMLSLTSRNELLEGPRLMLMVTLVQCTLSFRLARRDANRRLVLISGFLNLAIGGAVLAVESWALLASDRSEYHAREALLLVGSVVFLVIGAAVIQDSIWGTRVRERGIEMFCTTQPWSRIVVKEWRAREGGFALHLTLLPPRALGMQLEVENEIIIPVSATQRPALEEFLTGHAAAAG